MFRLVNGWYALTILWLYLAAFLLGLGFIFVFPQIVLGLVFLGLGGLGFAVLGGRILGGIEHSLARKALASGQCPVCQQGVSHLNQTDLEWHCEACALDFNRSGWEFPHIAANVPAA